MVEKKVAWLKDQWEKNDEETVKQLNTTQRKGDEQPNPSQFQFVNVHAFL